MKSSHPGLATFVTVMLPGKGVTAAVGRVLADRGGSLGPHAPGRASATFHNDGDAVAAALAVRTALSSTTASLHTGLAHAPGSAGSPGPAVRHCERLCEIANRGQVLVSAHIAAAVAERSLVAEPGPAPAARPRASRKGPRAARRQHDRCRHAAIARLGSQQPARSADSVRRTSTGTHRGRCLRRSQRGGPTTRRAGSHPGLAAGHH